MGKFNLRKMKKTASQESVPSYGQMLNEYNKDFGNTVDKGSIPNYNGLLDESRTNKDHTETHEALLDKPRSEALHATSGTVEANIEKHGGPIAQRQHKDDDKHQVMPINVLSEWHDQQYRDAYRKAEGSVDKETAFWDKYIGEQILGERTKIPGNVPASGSGLQNEPARFENFNGYPTELYAKDSGKLGADMDKIAPMEGYKAASMQLESLRDADAMLLHVYYKAASENRPLSENENELVKGINADKVSILAQMIPPQATAMPHQQSNNPGDPTYIDSDPTRPYPGKPGSMEPIGDEEPFTGSEPIALPEGHEVPATRPAPRAPVNPSEPPIDPMIDSAGGLDEQKVPF